MDLYNIWLRHSNKLNYYMYMFYILTLLLVDWLGQETFSNIKSISFKKGARNSCVYEICRLLPRSKSSTNHNKTSPNPNLRKYTVKGFVMYIFLSNCFTWFHRNL